jgi:hypothetical protein
MKPLSRPESLLAAAVCGALLLALFGPPVAQPADYHAFADRHTRWGVPHAFDVLSNLPFAAVGLAGAWFLLQARHVLDRGQQALAALACAGLVLTAFGSSWYHWQPDDAGLLVDRGAMAVAFAGLLGLAACRITVRAGVGLGALILLAAPAALWAWFAGGDLLPWAVLQGAGMVLLVAVAWVRPEAGVLPVRWGMVVALYAVAKLLELGDHAVWQLTGEAVSGHTLKHLVAAAAAWPLVQALRAAARARQNASRLPLGAA